jgi:hypothetical protein
MRARPHFFPALVLVGFAVSLAGCALDVVRRGDAPARPPAMPTMAPAPAVFPIKESEVLNAALERGKQGDFSGALHLIEAVSEPAARLRLHLAVGSVLAERDPVAAAALARLLPAGPAREAGVERAARSWARRDPDAALRWSLAIAEPATAGLARRTVSTELVRANARAAVDRLLAIPARAARDEMVVFAAAAWTRFDEDAAVGWLSELRDDDLRPRVTIAVGFELAQNNPRRAIALAETLPEGRERWLLIAAIGQTWAATDAKGALGWARSLPAGEARYAAFAGVDTGLGVPGTRRRSAAPNTGGSGIRTRGGGAVLGALTAADTPEFLAWLATQPVGLSRDDAILEYVRQRGPAAGASLGPWVAALPGGPTRDRAIEIFVESLLTGSPAEAADWLRQLPRSDRSDEWVERTARAWLTTNPAAAEIWLRDIPLSAERKAQLLREAGR